MIMEEEENKIVLKCIHKITKLKMQPPVDKITKRPIGKSVRFVNSNGDVILQPGDTEMDRPFLIPEDAVFVIEDGTTFNLNDRYQANVWEAIRHSPYIAESRDQKDKNGNYVIDGSIKKYGKAEFYVERPDQEVKKRIDRTKLTHRAESYVFGDSSDGVHQKARILGSDMRHLPTHEVEEFLLDICKKNPQKIIEIYTGDSTQRKLFLIDCMDKRLITKVNGVYQMSLDGEEPKILGVHEDGVIALLFSPENATLMKSIKMILYPEYYSEDSVKTTTKKTSVKQ